MENEIDIIIQFPGRKTSTKDIKRHLAMNDGSIYNYNNYEVLALVNKIEELAKHIADGNL